METADERGYSEGLLKALDKCRSLSKITRQQYLTIKGQIASGDFKGAEKGLRKLLKRIERVS